MAYMDSYYVLSLNILKALGGDTSIVYPDADAIWDEINKIYNNAGNRFDIVPLEKNITENGQYDYYPDGDADAFMPVNINVNVPQKYTDEQVFEIESNAIQQGYNQGYVEGEAEGKLTGREEGYTDGYNTGYGTGVTDGGEAQKAKLVDITITENGVYTKEDGYKTVTVEIETGIPEEELQQMLKEAMDEGYQDGYAEGVDDGKEDGIAEQKEKLESTTFTENGTYTKEDGWNSVTVEVDVPTFDTETLSVELKSNGDYLYTPTKDGYSSVSVTVDVDTSGGGKPKIYNGFVLNELQNAVHYTKLADIDFSQYDWSDVYDLSHFFSGFYFGANDGDIKWESHHFDNFNENFNGKVVSCGYLLNNNTNNSPLKDTAALSFLDNRMHNCLDMSYMFCNQSNLITVNDNVSNWNTSNVVTTTRMFDSCSKLATVPLFDTSNVMDMSYMFNNCSKLTSVPHFDTSKVTNMCYMFNNCSKLTSVPHFDTSKVTDMRYMFYNCKTLTSVPHFDTSKVTDVAQMLSYCSNITHIPEFDLSRVTSIANMLVGCNGLKELPNFNTKSMETWPASSNWYSDSTEKIGIIDCDSTTNVRGLITYSQNIIELGGYRNLGMQSSFQGGDQMLTYAPNISKQSLLNVFNLLYDRAAAGYTIASLKLTANQMSLLSDDEKMIAINKGWSLTN